MYEEGAVGCRRRRGREEGGGFLASDRVLCEPGLCYFILKINEWKRLLVNVVVFLVIYLWVRGVGNLFLISSPSASSARGFVCTMAHVSFPDLKEEMGMSNDIILILNVLSPAGRLANPEYFLFLSLFAEENPPQHVQVPALGDLSSLKVHSSLSLLPDGDVAKGGGTPWRFTREPHTSLPILFSSDSCVFYLHG